MSDPGWVKFAVSGNVATWSFGGAWTIDHAAKLSRDLAEAGAPGSGAAVFDLGNLQQLDTSGAWLITRLGRAMDAAGIKVETRAGDPDLAALLQRVAETRDVLPAHPRRRNLSDKIAELGAGVETILLDSRDLVAFLGALVLALGRLSLTPWKLRWNAIFSHLEQTGLNALPIVGLINMLVGVVLAFQGADQLARFGAQTFTINMLGISVLREMAVLLTAIVVAGRSGSAFTAQIGTMQVNEEVDALRTIGLNPMDVLVVPRVIALVIALPLLTFFADMMGLLGGGLMCVVLLDISFQQYLSLLNQAITTDQFWVGMSKAPFFAVLIALVGCFEGLRVSGSAESVGRLTTRSVVESIFLVIIVDALFSVMFSYLEI
ncbi:ABC transporter permease [Dongia sp.]|uniref:ABC transporter permease n=1 Tax=Dongia sp. TaxID=1977262 RepID=UPI0035AFE04A